MYLATSSDLCKLVEGAELFLYLVASAMVGNATLVNTGDNREQNLVYFISKMLTDVESCYIDFERITLALRVATNKLRPYVHAHTINILSSYPIRAILHKPDAASKLLKWAIELSEFDIVYCPRLTIKG